MSRDRDQRRPIEVSEPVKSDKVRFRFTRHHTHTDLPFEAGDEITIESAWADIIESQGSGHRIQDKE